jgi:hypothetical protein
MQWFLVVREFFVECAWHTFDRMFFIPLARQKQTFLLLTLELT